ncbi:hypothetical protein IN07_17000 [Modestobacter caceresii]|uniref:Uncharacterized protein n=1 Tax=Modestobacter caceresii TaxID=1522368 RepID=A0A098Y4L3_9ACTN|nr:hypothetical protein IN07_17000 [Modestobacter caceresii]
MSEWVVPVLVLAVALAVAYRCCLRPLRSGACHLSPARDRAGIEGLDRQLRQSRAERDQLRAR